MSSLVSSTSTSNLIGHGHSSCSTILQISKQLPDDVHLRPVPTHTHKKVRAYIDGCYDVMHSGHYNAFRMAREMCDELIVGVHDADQIEATKKCPPLQTNEERIRLVGACKWVDMVVLSKEYAPDYVALLEKYECDFCIHGTDVNLTADGKDPFAEVKKLGKFRSISRVDSISTTEIITRLLKATSPDRREQRRTEEEEDADSYLLTTDRLCQFMNTSRHRPHVPQPGQTVVYIGGSWDLFHSGHARLLQEAKKLGDFLLVGIHEDSTVTTHAGDGHPIMNLFERSMNVLGIRDVDEVVFDAPFLITREMAKFLRVRDWRERPRHEPQRIDVIVDASLNIDYPHDSTDVLESIRDGHESSSSSSKLLKKMGNLLKKHNDDEPDSRPDPKIVKIELPKNTLTNKVLHERVDKSRDFYLRKTGKSDPQKETTSTQ